MSDLRRGDAQRVGCGRLKYIWTQNLRPTCPLILVAIVGRSRRRSDNGAGQTTTDFSLNPKALL